MKIDSTDSNRIQKDSKVNKSKVSASDKDKKREVVTGELGSEKIVISNNARDIQKVIKTVNESPDIRAEKVNEIREKIKSGDYHVDSKEIANKMLKDLLI